MDRVVFRKLKFDHLRLGGDFGDNFKKWRQQFEIYMIASSVEDNNEITGARKAATLLHTIGAEALEIYNTLDISEDDIGVYKKVLNKFQSYFIPMSNESVNGHLFFTREQK